MSGNFDDLIRVASGSQNQGAFIFRTTDTKATVETANYFNFGVNVLSVGDVIFCCGDLSGTPYVGIYTVNSNDGTNVGIVAASSTPYPGAVVRLPDISNKAADAAVVRFVAPYAATITGFQTVLNAALATGDATLTLAINGTNVTGGAITVTQASSAAGDVDTATITALNTVAKGDVITVTGGGASTATSTSGCSLTLLPS